MFGAIAGGALGGTQPDHENTKSVPMQRGARFSFFGDRSMFQHGLNEGVTNIYKTNAILHIFKVKCTLGAATKCIRKTKFATRGLKMNVWCDRLGSSLRHLTGS